MSGPIKPPLLYFGGKMRLAKHLTKLMPPHQHYVEPYAGSLAVLMAKPRAAHETVNDLDGDLVHFWRTLRERPDELETVCTLTPHARAEQRDSYEPTDDPIERARRVWVQLTQGRAGVRTKTGWRHYVDPSGSVSSMPRYLRGYVERFGPAVERLYGVSLENQPAIDIVRRYGKSERVLLYVDPPYVSSVRSSGSYRHEMTDDDHRELPEALGGCEAAVILSGYHSPLYDELLDGWHIREIESMTGQGGCNAVRTEVAWSNRPFASDEADRGDAA